jgi:hypothetical protein
MARNTDKEVLDFLDSLEDIDGKATKVPAKPSFTPFVPSSAPKPGISTFSPPKFGEKLIPATSNSVENPVTNPTSFTPLQSVTKPLFTPFQPRTNSPRPLSKTPIVPIQTPLYSFATASSPNAPLNVASNSQNQPISTPDLSPEVSIYNTIAPKTVDAPVHISADTPTDIHASIAPPPIKTAFNPKQHVPIHPKTRTGYVHGYNSNAQTAAFTNPPIVQASSVEEEKKSEQQQSAWNWGSVWSTASKSIETAKSLAGNAANAVGTNETVRGLYKNMTPELEKLCILFFLCSAIGNFICWYSIRSYSTACYEHGTL